MKTIKQIAEEIANDAYKVNSNKSTIARNVEKALRDERERCAKIADTWSDGVNVIPGAIASEIREEVSHDSKT